MEGLAEAYTHLHPLLSHTPFVLPLALVLLCTCSLPPHPSLSPHHFACSHPLSLAIAVHIFETDGMPSKILLLTREHDSLLQNELTKKATSFYVAALAFRAVTCCTSLASQHKKCWGFFTGGLLTVHCFSSGVLLGIRYFLSQVFGEPLNCVRRRHT